MDQVNWPVGDNYTRRTYLHNFEDQVHFIRSDQIRPDRITSFLFCIKHGFQLSLSGNCTRHTYYPSTNPSVTLFVHQQQHIWKWPPQQSALPLRSQITTQMGSDPSIPSLRTCTYLEPPHLTPHSPAPHQTPSSISSVSVSALHHSQSPSHSTTSSPLTPPPRPALHPRLSFSKNSLNSPGTQECNYPVRKCKSPSSKILRRHGIPGPSSRL